MKTYVINLSDNRDRNQMVFTADGFMAAGKSIPESYTDQEQAIKAFYGIGREDFLRAGLKGHHELILWLTEYSDGDNTVIRQRNITFEDYSN